MRRSKRRRLILVGVGLALLAGILQILPPRGEVIGPNAFRAAQGSRPLIIAHAGGAGLAPENTMEAFERSVAVGCDVLEIDLRLTRDVVLVAHHDEGIDRTSNGKGLIRDLTFAELSAFNYGYQFQDVTGRYSYRDRRTRLVRLEEVLEKFPHMPLVLELKDRGEVGQAAARALALLVGQPGVAGRVMVASFDRATLDTFRGMARRVLTSASESEVRKLVILSFLWLDVFARGGPAALQIPVKSSMLRLDRARLVRAAQRRNWAVHYWTVNDREEMSRLIRLGVDGIMTDHPDVLRDVLIGMGQMGRIR